MSHGTVLRLGCVAASTPLITSSPPPLRAAPIFEFDSCPLRGMQGPAPLRRASPPSEAAPKPLCHCRPAAARMLRITSLFPDPPVRRKNTSSDAALWAARMLAISDKRHAGRPLVNPQACHETQLQSSFLGQVSAGRPRLLQAPSSGLCFSKWAEGLLASLS